MLYAHLSHVEEILDALFPCKVAHALALLRRLDVSVGGKVIEYERDVVLIAQLTAAALEYIDCNGCGHIVGHCRIHIYEHEVTRLERLLRLSDAHALLCS